MADLYCDEEVYELIDKNKVDTNGCGAGITASLIPKKEQALKVLVVSTDSGKVFYADTDSRLDLQAALVASELEGTNETMWKLAEAFEGSMVVSVSVDEIREAVVLALKAKGKLVIQ